MIPYAELELFFSRLVSTTQERGIACAITSGMVSVHFGVAATTKDCDVLCDAAKSDDFRELIAATRLRGQPPQSPESAAKDGTIPARSWRRFRWSPCGSILWSPVRSKQNRDISGPGC